MMGYVRKLGRAKTLQEAFDAIPSFIDGSCVITGRKNKDGVPERWDIYIGRGLILRLYELPGKVINAVRHIPWTSKQRFERGYIRRSHITREFYDATQITLPCHCGEPGCKGWAAVSKSPLSIKAHVELYGRDAHD